MNRRQRKRHRRLMEQAKKHLQMADIIERRAGDGVEAKTRYHYGQAERLMDEAIELERAAGN